jgi:DNA-binding CsgD family transcriptional regulator/tetratricopeptide (TPR) repeat protein
VFTDVTKASALLEQSVALARQEGDTWSLANSLGWRGFLAIFHGDFKAARPVLEDCLAVARPARNLHGLRIGLLSLGCIARFEGDCQAAEALYKEGLAVALKLGDPLWTAVALAYLADLVNLTGFPTRARQLAEEAVTVARNARCSPVLALCLTVAGRVVLADRDFTYARALLDEALSLPQVQPCSGALALLGLAQIAFACGESHSTQPLAENALAVAREGGDKMATAQVVHYLGRLARIEGNFKDAWSLHYEALMLQAKLGDRTGALTSLAAIAGVAVDQDRWDFAVRLLAATQAFRETMGIPRPSSEQAEHEADIAAIRGNIPSAQLKTAWAQGAAMSLDGAIAYAVRGRGIRRRPRSGWASLTPTELEVVRLVAEGLTNPQIGERLFVSPRTVQTHLSNIFPKLAVRSRKELAREVARRKI